MLVFWTNLRCLMALLFPSNLHWESSKHMGASITSSTPTLDLKASGLKFFVTDTLKIWYSLKFLRGKYFMVLANSAQKQIIVDKSFVVKVPGTHCICYGLGSFVGKKFMWL